MRPTAVCTAPPCGHAALATVSPPPPPPPVETVNAADFVVTLLPLSVATTDQLQLPLVRPVIAIDQTLFAPSAGEKFCAGEPCFWIEKRTDRSPPASVTVAWNV